MKGQIFIIGRDSSKVNIEIDHDTISAIHAQIVLLNGELLVVDLNSKNGVFVNNKKINNSKIKSGDEIAFGTFRCTYKEVLNAVKQSQFEKGKTSLPVVLTVPKEKLLKASISTKSFFSSTFLKRSLILLSIVFLISLIAVIVNNYKLKKDFLSKIENVVTTIDSTITNTSKKKKKPIRKQKDIVDDYDFTCMEDEKTLGNIINVFTNIKSEVEDQLYSEIQISIEEEEQYGDDLYKDIEKEYSFIDSGSDYERLNSILINLEKRLLNPRGFNYKIHLVDDEIINAYTVGGRIFFFKGLYDFCENDSEIASIIGHEIGHNELGHINDQLRKMAAAEEYGDLGNIALSLSSLMTKPFNQKQEVECDFFGSDLMYPTTYKNCSSIVLWNRMSENENDPNLIENVFRTHPFSTKRSECIHHHLATHYGKSCED